MPHDTTATTPEINHRNWGVKLFNHTWSFLEKPERTPEETNDMIQAAHASAYHWSQAPENQPKNQNIGYWQLSRVYAEAGMPEAALHWGQACLRVAEEHDLKDFMLAYAYEALARASALAKNREARDKWYAKAEAATAEVGDEESRKMLAADLATIPIL